MGAKQVAYDSEADEIIIFDETRGSTLVRLRPEVFLDTLDDCLEMRIRKIRLNEANSLDRLAKMAWQFEKDLGDAEDRLEIYRINSRAKVVDRVRYVVKLTEMEEKRWKMERMERMLEGEKK